MVRAKKFEKDEDIYGKWPGSLLYYKGIVKKYDEEHDRYTVLFENDDTDMELPAKDIMSKVYFDKFQTRRTRSRSKSPGRSRRRRSKSPSRETKALKTKSTELESSISPKTRRSGSRSPRSPARVLSQQKYVKREASYIVKRVESEQSAIIEKQSLHVIKSFADSSVETISHSRKNEELTHSNVNKHANNQSQISREPFQESQPSTDLTHRISTRSVTKSLEKQSKIQDEKSEVYVKNQSDTIMSKFCYMATSLMYISVMFVPLALVLGMYLTCGKKSCTFLKIVKQQNFKKLFATESISFVFGWFTFQAILSALPIGKLVLGPVLTNNTRLQYRLNGLPSFFVSLTVAIALVKFKYLQINFIVNRLPALIIASFLFAFILSIVVLIQTRFSPSSTEISNGVIPDFVVGRLVNPMLFNSMFHVKTFAFKSGYITWGVLNVYYLLKAWTINKNVLTDNASLVILTIFQLWYIVKDLYLEETLLYTASLSKEKIGFLSISALSAFFGFFCSFQTRYLSIQPLSLPWYCYIVPIILQVIGSYIYTMSVLQKFQFRKDSHSAILSGVNYIKTANGKHLLVDGWWAKLRHPNYTGDLMMCTSWGALCGFRHFHPWVWSVFLFFMLIGMAVNDDRNCKKNYKSSWDEYRRRVKYSVIPFIY